MQYNAPDGWVKCQFGTTNVGVFSLVHHSKYNVWTNIALYIKILLFIYIFCSLYTNCALYIQILLFIYIFSCVYKREVFVDVIYQLKNKRKFLYSAVSNPQDFSKRFTFYSPDRPVHSDTISTSLGSSQRYAIINAKRLHISTTVYSQVLIYTSK